MREYADASPRAQRQRVHDSVLGLASDAAAAVIGGLLHVDESRRLRFPALHASAFFAPLDWAALLRRELEPPFAPDVQDAVVVDPSELELPPDPDDGEAVWDPAFAAFGPLVSVGSELAS